jgi:putative hemolysin
VIPELLALAALFLCSAFFSASEAALTTLSSLDIRKLTVLLPTLSRHFADWLAMPHRLLVTILVGNNAVNLAASSLTAAVAAPLAAVLPDPVLGVLVWLATTVVLLGFGEVAPKIIGRAYPEKMSIWAVPVLGGLTRVFHGVLRPALWLVERLAPGLDSPPVGRLTALTLEELSYMIRESQASGQVPADAGEMMGRVLALHHRTAADILAPASQTDVVALEVLDRGPGAGELFVDLLVESGRTRVPVTRAGVPVGYIHVMDILKEWRGGSASTLDNLIRTAPAVPPEKPVAELLSFFQQSGEHLTFVENEAGEFQGLVTLEDVMEEIVGEILDEYDWERKKA